jgi:hypothetical protein
MRICLFANHYPANNLSDAESAYVTELARGLDALGHEVTVICAHSKVASTQGKIRVISAAPSAKISKLRLVRRRLPKSASQAASLIGFWHAFAECGKTFDVVEAGQGLSGALLSAFSRETPSVLRVNGRRDVNDDELSPDRDFDSQLPQLISDFAFSCVDIFSCASSSDADFLLQRGRSVEQVTVNSAQHEGDLASSAVDIYEAAIDRFSRIKQPYLYRHGAQRLIKSTEDMISIYDQMLYDLLFRVSYRFRIGHWLNKLCSNPGAFKAKLLQKLSQKA